MFILSIICLFVFLVSSVTKGKQMIPVMKSIGVHASVFGNHDFGKWSGWNKNHKFHFLFYSHFLQHETKLLIDSKNIHRKYTLIRLIFALLQISRIFYSRIQFSRTPISRTFILVVKEKFYQSKNMCFTLFPVSCNLIFVSLFKRNISRIFKNNNFAQPFAALRENLVN